MATRFPWSCLPSANRQGLGTNIGCWTTQNEETPNPTQATGETNSGAHGTNRRIPLAISSTDWRVRIGEKPGFPEKPILAPFPLPDGFYGGKGK